MACVVCGFRFLKKSEGNPHYIGLHKFPTKNEYHQKWTEFVCLSRDNPTWRPKKGTRICSKHFEAECFDNNRTTCTGAKFLKANALPTMMVSDIPIKLEPKIILSTTTSKELTTMNAVHTMRSRQGRRVTESELTTHSKVMNKPNVRVPEKISTRLKSKKLSKVNVTTKPVISKVLNQMNVRGLTMPSVNVFYMENNKEETISSDPLKDAIVDVKPVLACLVCLVTDQPLRLLYSNLAEALGQMINELDIHPQYICTYCRALLLRFITFKEKCLWAQEKLTEIRTIMDGQITLDMIKSYIPNNMYSLQTDNTEIISYQPPNTKTTKTVNTQPISKKTVNTQPISKKTVNMQPIGQKTVNTQPISQKTVNMQPIRQKTVIMQPIQPLKPIHPNTTLMKQENVKKHNNTGNENKPKTLQSLTKPKQTINEDRSLNELAPEYLEGDIEYLEDFDTDDDVVSLEDVETDDKVYLDVDTDKISYFMPDAVENSKLDIKMTQDLESPKSEVDTATYRKNAQGMKCMTIQMNSSGLDIDIGNWSDTDNQAVKPVVLEYPNVLPEENIVAIHHIKKVELTKDQQIQQILDRKDTNNYKLSKYKCEFCYHGFSLKFTFDNHLKRHELIKGNAICEICKWSVNKNKLMSHNTTRHRYNYICSKCGHVEKGSERAYHHYEWHYGVKHMCKICHQSFNKKSSVFGHMLMKHKDALTPCIICGNLCVGDFGLKQHIKRSHKEAKDAVCASCKVQFYSVDALRRHSETPDVHVDHTIKPCNACGEGFISQQLLTEHQMHCTPLIKARTFTCDVCNKSFESMTRLRNHSAFKCTTTYYRNYKIYNKDTMHQKLLYQQYRREKEGPFVCKICGCIKKNKVLVDLHIRSHHNKELQYQCDYCGKRFIHKYSIQAHIANHLGINKQHFCKHCGVKFTSRGNVIRHELTQHKGLLRSKCEICNQTFTTKASMQSHVRHTHEGAPWPKRVRVKNKQRRETADQQ